MNGLLKTMWLESSFSLYFEFYMHTIQFNFNFTEHALDATFRISLKNRPYTHRRIETGFNIYLRKIRNIIFLLINGNMEYILKCLKIWVKTLKIKLGMVFKFCNRPGSFLQNLFKLNFPLCILIYVYINTNLLVSNI